MLFVGKYGGEIVHLYLFEGRDAMPDELIGIDLDLIVVAFLLRVALLERNIMLNFWAFLVLVWDFGDVWDYVQSLNGKRVMISLGWNFNEFLRLLSWVSLGLDEDRRPMPRADSLFNIMLLSLEIAGCKALGIDVFWDDGLVQLWRECLRLLNYFFKRIHPGQSFNYFQCGAKIGCVSRLICRPFFLNLNFDYLLLIRLLLLHSWCLPHPRWRPGSFFGSHELINLLLEFLIWPKQSVKDWFIDVTDWKGFSREASGVVNSALAWKVHLWGREDLFFRWNTCIVLLRVVELVDVEQVLHWIRVDMRLAENWSICVVILAWV